MSHDITCHELRSALVYDPNDGIFRWNVGRHFQGKEAGGITPRGYRSIQIGHRCFLAHRLAWFYTTGAWPLSGLDHINRNKLDNRIANLREATVRQNSANASLSSANTSGMKGVRLHRSRPGQRARWQARIMSGGKLKSLGNFDTAAEAARAYAIAAIAINGGYTPDFVRTCAA